MIGGEYHCLDERDAMVVYDKPTLQKAYDLYSFSVLPLLGRLIAADADSYRYLAESIRMHPDQETLKAMMEQAQAKAKAYEAIERIHFDGAYCRSDIADKAITA